MLMPTARPVPACVPTGTGPAWPDYDEPDDSAARTLDALQTTPESTYTLLEIGEYGAESDEIGQILMLAACRREHGESDVCSDGRIAARVMRLLDEVLANRRGSFWETVDDYRRKGLL